jgi:hypothetical protein
MRSLVWEIETKFFISTRHYVILRYVTLRYVTLRYVPAICIVVFQNIDQVQFERPESQDIEQTWIKINIGGWILVVHSPYKNLI